MKRIIGIQAQTVNINTNVMIENKTMDIGYRISVSNIPTKRNLKK
jgi:hypothetical protein